MQRPIGTGRIRVLQIDPVDALESLGLLTRHPEHRRPGDARLLHRVGMDVTEGVGESGVVHGEAHRQRQGPAALVDPRGVNGPIKMGRRVPVTTDQHRDVRLQMAFGLKVLKQ